MRTEHRAEGGNESGLHRRELVALPSLRVYGVQATIVEPVIRRQEVHHDRHLLSLGVHGTVLFVHGNPKQTKVLPSESALYVYGEARSRVYYARGKHARIEIEWHTNELRGLSNWVRRLAVQNGTGSISAVNLRAAGIGYSGKIQQLRTHLHLPPAQAEPFLLAHIHDFVGAAMVMRTTSCLAEIPDTAPEPLRSLMNEVKSHPTAAWSLKEAAVFAGYSPFHLSRTFRSVLEYGFPEFVDRCRTEVAIERLITSEAPIEEVSASCGFGSTQALRESFKEYLGLLPSELRTLTHDDHE